MGANKTPLIDLMNADLKHYEEASSAISHSSSSIPKAITEYWKKRIENEGIYEYEQIKESCKKKIFVQCPTGIINYIDKEGNITHSEKYPKNDDVIAPIFFKDQNGRMTEMFNIDWEKIDKDSKNK